MGFFGEFKRAREQRQAATEVAAILGPHVQEYFSLPRLAEYHEEWRNNVKANFAERTTAIMQAETPILALREEIAAAR
jgi:hypothetical protein